MAVPCGSQGRKRPALGETSSQGKSGIPAAPIFAAAGCPARELMQRADEGIGPYGNAESHSPAVGADALIRSPVQAATTPRGARSEAERAEREAGQMRPCTPIPSAPAPRESAVKSTPYPAAPVGRSSQTRRHHLTSTPVQRGGTYVPERDKKRSFLLDRARPVFFSARPKRKWGVHCPAINIADFPTQTGGLPFTAR